MVEMIGLWMICGATAVVGAAWQAESGWRWAELEVPAGGRTGFTLLPAGRTGIGFTNRLDEANSAANRILLNGAGVAVGDFDGDGWVDVFFCGLDSASRLYRNAGDWRFEDVTAAAGLAGGSRYDRGAVFADVNGDGWLDLLIATSGGGVLCYSNHHRGGFTEATAFAGTASEYGSFTLALADVDGNGTLDLYVANYHVDDFRDHPLMDVVRRRGQELISPRYPGQLLMVNGRLFQLGQPDVFYLNDGQGRFTAVEWTGGRFRDEAGRALAEAPREWGLTVTFRDFNGDGHPDIYECNDFLSPDRFWLNDGRGNFRAIEASAVRHTSASSMGVDCADIDRDGRMDFFVLDMMARDHRLRKRQVAAQPPMHHPVGVITNRPQIMRSTLFHQRGDGTFAEIADYAGLSASDWSWQPMFVDVNLDGYEDLLVATGHIKDVQDLDAIREINSQASDWARLPTAEARQREFTRQLQVNWQLNPPYNTPIVAYRNLGNLQFAERTGEWGTDQAGVHHGLVLADFDNDGDADLAVNNLGSVAGLYRNESSAPRVAVRLRGRAPNTQGIGARIRLLGGAVPMQSQEMVCGGRYLSGSDPRITFAAGAVRGGMVLEVTWRKGHVSVISNVLANRWYEIDEAASTRAAEPARLGPPPAPMFRDVSARLAHVHRDEWFNDFERQPLLPKRLSQLGPGLAWFDFDADGHEDLIIGSGRGGQLALYRGDGRGGVARASAPGAIAGFGCDQTGVVGWHRPDGRPAVLVGVAGYELRPRPGVSVRQYDPAAGTFEDLLPGMDASVGPLALADMDGDGQLDLFVGGRVLPGRYPEAASSRIHRWDGAVWRLDEENSRVLEGVGMVSGAVWSDLDGDGLPELVLACEWGAIRVFRNRAGRIGEITAELGLDRWTGRWQGIGAGDLNGDGRMDLVAGNWGLNSSYQATGERPARLYYGDLADRGMVDLVETEYAPDTGAVVPRRRLMALGEAMPFLYQRVGSHREYSESTVAALLGDRGARAGEVQATTLASMVFLNRGDRFEGTPLPAQAQFAPVFAVNIADLDGDGHEDVFLSQNFFATQPETPRLDAGQGLWLRGDGTGRLTPVPPQESGIRIDGEQRGAALADFNEDGRVDLAVTQNGAETRLYENAFGRPGLRIRLRGPAGNPAGIGAVLRWQAGERFGPAREIHAGAGYWSQDSAVQVMVLPGKEARLQVRWPGGKVSTVDVPAGARQITADFEGRR